MWKLRFKGKRWLPTPLLRHLQPQGGRQDLLFQKSWPEKAEQERSEARASQRDLLAPHCSSSREEKNHQVNIIFVYFYNKIFPIHSSRDGYSDRKQGRRIRHHRDEVMDK